MEVIERMPREVLMFFKLLAGDERRELERLMRERCEAKR
jgi:hypothetical protein